MIYGKIVNCKFSKEGGSWRTTFSVYQAETNKIYRCEAVSYLSLMISDIVLFDDREVISDSGINIIMHTPLVKMDFTDNFVKDYLTPSMKKYPVDILEAYEYLRDSCNSTDTETIVAYIEDMVRYIDKGGVVEVNFNPLALESMLVWFKKNVCIRRFRLFGLTNEEIKNLFMCHDMAPYTLHSKIFENPYMLYPAGLEACNKVASIVRYNPTKEQMLYGSAIIEMWKYVQELGWTCIEGSIVPEIIHKNKEHFEAEYNIKWFGNYLYFPITYRVEMGLSKWFKKQLATPLINQLKVDPEIVTNQEQADAIAKVFEQPLSVLVGEAGTGKTTLISLLISHLIKQGVTYHVCSFTGKAVQRAMQVVSDKDVSIDPANFTTIHRLMLAKEHIFKFLIIDEVSMVSMPLFYSLITKLKNHDIQVLMVGDPNQLEPIEWGHLLEVIVHARSIPVIKLVTNHRQSNNGLLTNVRNILESKPALANEQFTIIPCANNDEIYGHVFGILQFIQASTPTDKVMVVCPYSFHLQRINTDMKEILRNQSYGNLDVTDKWGTNFKAGDRVMMTENIDLIFNGDEGIIISINNSSVTVKWDRLDLTTQFSLNAEFDYEDFSLSLLGSSSSKKAKSSKMLQIAYGITCHKSQGSEWDGLIFVLPYHKRNSEFVNKRMVYTALTRAKKYCYVVGDARGFQRAIRSDNVHTSTLLPYHIDNV